LLERKNIGKPMVNFNLHLHSFGLIFEITRRLLFIRIKPKIKQYLFEPASV